MKKKNIANGFKIKFEYFIYLFCLGSIIFVGNNLYSKRYSTIEGNLLFLSDTPFQTVCAVNNITKKETCTKKDHSVFPADFSMKVEPGQYFIYSSIDKDQNNSNWDFLLGQKAFYTRCSKEGCFCSGIGIEEMCNGAKVSNGPILVEVKAGEVVVGIRFDWGKAMYGEPSGQIITPAITSTPTLKPTKIPTQIPTPTHNQEVFEDGTPVDGIHSKSQLLGTFCDTPVELINLNKVESLGNGKVKLNWTPLSYTGSSYSIFSSKRNTGFTLLTSGGSSGSVEIGGLEVNSKYYFLVQFDWYRGSQHLCGTSDSKWVEIK